MRLFEDRQDETINQYILLCEIIFFLIAGIFILRLSDLTMDNFFSKFPVLALLIVLLGLVPMIQKISSQKYHWSLEFITGIFYILLVSFFLRNEYEYLFKLTLLMPVIVMALKYGIKMAFIAAFLSIFAALALSYMQGFASIDADIIFCEIILLLAWLLGQMTETEYQIRLNLQEEIFARKRAEKELKDQLCFLQNLIDTIPSPIYFTDLNWVFMGCNKAFVDFFGISKENIVNKTVSEIVPPDVARKLEKTDGASSESNISVLEVILLNAQGAVREVVLNKAPFFNNEGNVAGSVGTIIDITEQKQFQKDMAQVDRLNLVGEMAAGIAHEIRNPITTVRGFLQLFQINVDTKTLQENTNLMIEELDRANAIITDYLSLAKSRVLNLTPQNLNSIILSIAPLIEADAILSDKNMNLQLGDIPDSLLDETQIRQMLLNLCRNGLEAMAPGGSLTLSTYVEDKEIVLTIKDQGKGIALELVNKIGTPFVTGKENGTGLGLAVCYSIAVRHNAAISFETGPQGTTFFVRFKSLNAKEP